MLAVRRALRAELLASNIEIPEADDFLSERYAANAAATAAADTPADCTTATEAADYAIAAAGDDELTWKLVSLDVARIRKLVAANSAEPPLSGWDDPRLGPLWPEMPPQWHSEAVRDVRELRAKLAARPNPTAPPMHEDTRRQLNDYKALAEMGKRGELDPFRGEYVVVYRGELVGHGPDLNAIRTQVAQERGVPASRIVGEFIR